MPPSHRRVLLVAALAPVLALSGCSGLDQDYGTRALATVAVAPVLVHDAPVRLVSGATPALVACHPQPTLPAPGRPEAVTATIAVVVPATTLVRLDASGLPVTASTNTGQAPCRTDVFVVERDGATTPAPGAVRAAVLGALAGSEDGGWTPGSWRPVG